MSGAPNTNKDLVIGIGEAPPQSKQRSFMTAFQRFILNPANKNRGGFEWTPNIILAEFYSLAPEALRLKFPTILEFSDEFLRGIKNIRYGQVQGATRDPRLLELIKLFLVAHDILPAPPRHIRYVQEAIRIMSRMYPPGGSLPGPVVHNAKVAVYEIDQEGVTRYLGITTPAPKYEICCPAIAFSGQGINFIADIQYGFYCYGNREATLRTENRETTIYHRYSFDFANPDGRRDLGLSYSHHGVCELDQRIVQRNDKGHMTTEWRRIITSFDRVSTEAVIKVAEAHLTCFDM
jgi:hypothetical protein